MSGYTEGSHLVLSSCLSGERFYLANTLGRPYSLSTRTTEQIKLKFPLLIELWDSFTQLDMGTPWKEGIVGLEVAKGVYIEG